MKLKGKIFLFILLTVTPLFSVTTITDYAAKRKWPANFGIYYLNQPPVYYAEDFYELYAKRNYYGESEINLNIIYMQGALKSPFRPAYKALVPLHSKRIALKYQNLLKMHMNLRILKDYLYLGRLYDMPKLYFYHKKEVDDLIKSLQFAEYYYKIANNYWTEVKKQAVNAFLISDVYIDLDNLEDEMNFIVTRRVDWQFDRIIKINLLKVQDNLKKLKEFKNNN